MNLTVFKTSLLIVCSLFLFGCQSEGSQGSEDQSEQQSLDEGLSNMQQQMPTDAGVSQEELRQFAALSQKIQIANQELQQKMMQELEKQGMEMQRFNELQQAARNPQSNVDATDEELAQFQATSQALTNIQAKAQQDIQKQIEAQGLSQERRQEINMALQNSPELQAALQQIQQQQQQAE